MIKHAASSRIINAKEAEKQNTTQEPEPATETEASRSSDRGADDQTNSVKLSVVCFWRVKRTKTKSFVKLLRSLKFV
jgi:hypothetical protein